MARKKPGIELILASRGFCSEVLLMVPTPEPVVPEVPTPEPVVPGVPGPEPVVVRLKAFSSGAAFARGALYTMLVVHKTKNIALKNTFETILILQH